MDEIGAKLHRLANTDPLGPIDGHELLARGKRSRRRRRLLSAGGGIAGIAAVAVGATMLPHLGVAADRPTASGGSSSAATRSTATADFTAVPGVPRGEAGAGKEVSYAEATRLCTLRYPKQSQDLQKQVVYRTGMTVMRQMHVGEPATFQSCTIPGGDRPSAALIAAARKDPMPSTEAGQLRNCSVQFWSDLTKWRVIARETAAATGTTLVALSPSGKTAVECTLAPTWSDNATPLGSGPGLWPVAKRGQDLFDKNFDFAGGQSCATIRPCPGWAYLGTGRVSSNIAKITIEPVGGGKHDVPVVDGWYAVAWLNGDKQGRPEAKLTAYDKQGKVLKVIYNYDK